MEGRDAAKVSRAIYRNVGAAGTRRALLERGDADVVPDLPPRDVVDILAGKKLTVASTPMANTLKYLALSTIISRSMMFASARRLLTQFPTRR